MGFKRVLNSRVAAVAAGATALAVLAGGVGYAAGEITSKDIKNDTIRSGDIRDNAIKLKDINDGAEKKLKGERGKDGRDGASLAASLTSEPTVIEHLGGSFATQATQVDALELPEAGTYVINGYAFFDTAAADSPRTDGTHLMLALRTPPTDSSAFGDDLGTCFTGAFPQGDREATCQTTRTITVTEATTVNVKAFGYNEDQSSTGSGTFTTFVDVSAIKVAPAA